MERCRNIQDQMLEFVYGLLDDEVGQTLTLHLEDCDACRLALGQARRQQQRLASAARLEFAGVRFEPPVAVAEPASLPFPAPHRSAAPRPGRKTWRLVRAAAVLLALMVPAALGLDYSRRRQELTGHQAHQAALKSQVAQINDKVASLSAERERRLADVEHDVRAHQLKLVVSGPASIQAGGVNEYQIQTRDGNDRPVPATIVAARVIDETGEVLHQETGIATESGTHRLALPASLPVKPHNRLALQVVARRRDGPQSELRDKLTLAAPVYRTHLATDKPIYNPGETVRFRSLTLDRFSLEPAAEPLELYYSVTAPDGEERMVRRGHTGTVRREGEEERKTVKGPDGQPLRGVGVGEWQLDSQAAGGEYVLTVRDAADRFPAQQRRFLVNNYQTPRLVKKLEFSQRGYGPGEEVLAQVEARTNGGGPLPHCPVEATVMVDDQLVGGKAARFVTDAAGKVTVRFRLPEKIANGQAALRVNFLDGGSPDPLLKPVPIVLDRLLVDFYPEGGDLVAGVPNRVYFQVQTPQGRPADLRGRVLTGNQTVAEVRTLSDDKEPGVNQGQGVFTFTPQAGRAYELAIEQPVGIKQRVKLPALKDSGVVLSVPTGVTTAHKPIEVEIYNVGKDRSLLVGAYCRGRLFDHRTLEAQAGEHYTLSLKPSEKLGGVYRITVFEEGADDARPALSPLAERLIYRHQGERLNIDLTPGQAFYRPGEQARLKVATRGENQELTPAVVMVAVTDKGALSLADEKTARSMPTHFLLTSEVREPEELEHADFLLSPHPLAERALDLLLGTQGWRRFAEQKPEDFRRSHPEEAARLLPGGGARQGPGETLLVSRAHNAPEVQAFARAEYLRVNQDVRQEALRLQGEKETARAELLQAEADPAFIAVAGQLESYHRILRRVQLFFPVAGLLLIMAGVVALGKGLARPVGRSAPLFSTAAACAALLIVLGTVAFLDVPARERGLPSDSAQVAVAPLPPLTEEKPTAALGARPEVEKEAGVATTRPVSPTPAPSAPGGVAPPGDDGKKDRTGGPRAPGAPALGSGGAPATRFGGDWKKATEGKDEDRAGSLAERLRREKQTRDDDARGGGPATGLISPADKGPARGGPGKPGVQGAREGKNKEADDEWALGRFVVREYAHSRPLSKGRQPRSDDTETVYWHPVLILPDGRAEVAFGLSEQVTTYQVTAYGHTLDGRLAAASATFDARLPFSLSAVIPPEVSSTDRFQVPITVTNATDKDQNFDVQFGAARGVELKQSQSKLPARAAARQPTRQLFSVQPSTRQGEATFRVDAYANELGVDSLEKRVRIVPEGFPVEAAHSGMLERSDSANVLLPADWVKGTLGCRVQVFPSTLANLQQGLEGLLREPAGCFEQSSTANYPNVLILQYLRATQQNQPDIEARARILLARGYTKLTSFECENTTARKREGYEWFGGTAPPHEALTAYGLLQFRDMASVHPVDPQMLARTTGYLMAQKDNKGGFRRNARAIDTFGRASQEITDAYIVWALTEGAGGEDVSAELTRLQKLAANSDDAYFVALVANGLLNRGRSKEGRALLDMLAKAQKDDGRVEGKEMSITASRGRDLHIETTALAMLGWLKADPGAYRASLEKSLNWLAAQRGGSGTFGSTQATILALKALIRHAEVYKHKPEAGTLSLFVGDRLVARTAFAAKHQEAITLDVPDAEQVLKAGKNSVRVEISSGAVLPWTLSWSYRTPKPASAAEVPLRLSTKLDRTIIREGDSVRLRMVLENVSGKGQGMAVAILGLPAGLSLPEDFKQMKGHLRPASEGGRPLVSMFEVRGRELILYWRDLAPGQKIEVPIDLLARLPGEFSGPASRAYLYYVADHKHWIDPLRVKIQPHE